MVQGPYDFWAHWNLLRDKLASGDFESQYAFDHAVYKTVQNVHDSHFKLVPSSVGEVFNFGGHLPLVSVSSNGSSLPEVYAYEDILRLEANRSLSGISPVTQINGEGVTDFLSSWSRSGSGVQDPDALWNALFYSVAQSAISNGDITSDHPAYGSFVGGDDAKWQYPGPETSLLFGNGTTLTMENLAVVLQPGFFSDVKTGTELYEKCCKPDPSLSLNVWESLIVESKASSDLERKHHQRAERRS